MALTAGAPLSVLISRLRRAGWGDLGGETLRGLRLVLDDLGDMLDARSGAGYITAPQIADRTGYTERWVRSRLTLLEELDLIEWHRGGVQHGKPVPSWIRVSKVALLDLIHIARRQQGERLTEAKRETRARLIRLRTGYTTRPGRRRNTTPSRGGKTHAELNAALLSSEEVRGRNRPPSTPADRPDKHDGAALATRGHAQSALARIRADLAARRAERAR